MQELVGYVYSVKEAVEKIIPCLEDTGRSAHKAIYFNGWDGLAASAVLRAIAEHPPPSLMNKFDRIIHIDCSRWKSRRALQRAIVDELKLPQSQRIMAAFDRQDMEDDFSGVDDGSRVEIAEVTREIYQTVRDLSCLVVFHNGSDNTVDMADFGFLPNPEYREWFSNRTNNKVLWTFRGMLRVNPEIKEKVDSSHLYIYNNIWWPFNNDTAQLILEEATEVVKHMQHKQSITPEIAAKCITYILWLHEMGGSTMHYNWASHASNYWVCDGIIEQQGQLDDEESWEVSAALHKQMQTMELSSWPVRFRGHEYMDVWKSVTCTSYSGEKENLTALSRNLTSFFLVSEGSLYTTLSCDMFQQSERLRVLKLSGSRFNFNSPPFCCCHSLRFLGLDHCEDQGREEENKQGRPIIEFFQSLWVLDISHTDWEFDLSQDLAEQMSNIREVYIKKGRIWRSHLAWRQLQNIRKLRVIEPTSSWETGRKDEFTDMEKMELLDLSGNSTIQVLPSLSCATCLRTLVLDGCVGLDHVGPEGLPPALETFSLDVRSEKLLKISLSRCACLESFLLRGELPGLEELNLSGTSIRRVDLRDRVVQVQGLKKVFLMGCKQLRAILWWEGARQLEVLCIDTLETEDTHPHYSVSNPSHNQHMNYVVTGDVRIIQSLLIKEYGTMITSNLYLDLHVPPTTNSRKSKGPSRDKVIPKSCDYTYSDVFLQGLSAYDSEMKWPPPLGRHMEVGEGISLIDVESDKGIKAIYYVTLKRIDSLHVHDNSCILAVTPKIPADRSYWVFVLKWCRVERCPKLVTVFASGIRYDYCYLETVWASDLPAAACIWSKGSIKDDRSSFQALHSIHLHECPRLKFALPMSRYTYLPRLETLHISQCGDLKQVFPWDDDDNVPQQYREADPVKDFPNLKHVLLHDLFSLQEICEAKMTAPMLESIVIRGCWGLRRLPAVGRNNNHRRPVVDCEKEWWAKLEWDGLHASHDPSLYEPRSSAYYKKRLLRCTVLR